MQCLSSIWVSLCGIPKKSLTAPLMSWPATEAHLVCTVNAAKARSVDSDNVMCSAMVRRNVVHSGTGTGSKTEVEAV